MSAVPLNPEEADNFEDIEKQFAVKGMCMFEDQYGAIGPNDSAQLSST